MSGQQPHLPIIAEPVLEWFELAQCTLEVAIFDLGSCVDNCLHSLWLPQFNEPSLNSGASILVWVGLKNRVEDAWNLKVALSGLQCLGVLQEQRHIIRCHVQTILVKI